MVTADVCDVVFAAALVVTADVCDVVFAVVPVVAAADAVEVVPESAVSDAAAASALPAVQRFS